MHPDPSGPEALHALPIRDRPYSSGPGIRAAGSPDVTTADFSAAALGACASPPPPDFCGVAATLGAPPVDLPPVGLRAALLVDVGQASMGRS